MEAITVGRAKALVSGQYGRQVDLRGTESISTPVAGTLARHKGMLNLDSLTSLSGGAAEALSDHKGGLSLNRLETLAPALASRQPSPTESYFSTESQSYRWRPSHTRRSSMAVSRSTA